MNIKQLNKRTLILVMGVFLFVFGTSFAQTNEDCLMCHDDDSFTMEKDGKEIPIYVSESKFSSSSHSKLKCVSCHTNFDPESIPHSDNLTPKVCGDCHQKQIVKHLFHPKILKATGNDKAKDVNCLSCHDNHYPQDPNAKGSKWSTENIPNSCGECHSEMKEQYLASEHFSAFKEGMLGAPTCLSCHKNPIARVHLNEDSVTVKISQEKPDS
ncbi:MAG: Formate dehydrogenase-like protein cytochrome b subunit [Ignavibacteriaceae bacterium]|nr:Formate dehydrogenase-like protein cytochrome b subunit [Ignavibacteriaceae bacterium]